MCDGMRVLRAVFVLAVVVVTSAGTSLAAVRGDTPSYDIEAVFDPETASIRVVATITRPPFNPREEVEFLLHGELRVSRVRLGERELPFTQQVVLHPMSYAMIATRVRIGIADVDFSPLTIEYGGMFNPSAARSPSDFMRVTRAGVFLRGYFYSLWFPVFASPDGEVPRAEFTSVRLAAPADFHSVFTGEHVGRSVKNGMAIDQWRSPVISLVDAQWMTRPYQLITTQTASAYSLKDHDSISASERILDFADRLTAHYKFAYVGNPGPSRHLYIEQLPKFGNIASGNLIGLDEGGWRGFVPTDAAAVTLAHELVHSYVQPPVARSDRLHAFVIEGFPSYFHWPALAALLGEDVYENRMDHVEALYLDRRRSGVDQRGVKLPPEVPLLALRPEDIGVYKDRFILNDRALLFWDYLRRHLGSARFDALVRETMTSSNLSEEAFYRLVGEHAPELSADIRTWLETTEFPEHFSRGAGMK